MGRGGIKCCVHMILFKRPPTSLGEMLWKSWFYLGNHCMLYCCISPLFRETNIKGTVKEIWKGVSAETYAFQELIETDKSSIWCSCLEKLITYYVKIIPKQIIFSKYATNLKKYDISEEPEKLMFSPFIIWI